MKLLVVIKCNPYMHSKTGELIPSKFLLILLIVAIALGICLRFLALDHKLYWHDEVYTSFRAAGFTSQEINRAIFTDQITSPQSILKFQELKPNSSALDTIFSLAIEDPQHPPLYYLASRLWMQIFGSSTVSMRSLAALISLIGLPLIYGLAWELFKSRTIALIAVIFLVLSPFDVLFAQIARQYSLLCVISLASSLCFLRAARIDSKHSWIIYSLVSVIGLYTHPFFGFTLVGHGTYLLILKLTYLKLDQDSLPIKRYLQAIALAALIYLPWICVMVFNYQRVSATTNWVTGAADWLFYIRTWLLSFTCLYFDLDWGFDNVWTYVPRLLIFILMVAGIYLIYRRTERQTFIFILTAIVVPFALLLLPDLILGGRRSTVTRYLIGSYAGLQLAIAYLVGITLQHRQIVGQILGRSLIVLLAACSIASCIVSNSTDTWWTNIPSYFNGITAKIVNSKPAPLLITDAENGINLADIISISHLLSDRPKLLLLSHSQLPKLPDIFSDYMVFRPSSQLRQAIGDKNLESIPDTGGELWRLKLRDNRLVFPA
ncbi:putative membrane protein [Synechococcus sp. PCC 7502]|uniref:glycosyltransferase family 39 protein n=1 Tax=Synechococcus sp. PCC 7502 TaxID=1173263 RepID=UPI00029FABEB|nr:glycosyltransferase family 39 protein [Synechococcus sp. PCC 7502]AFY73322.1 putative membrane protein [Synechococcus sp. PCC 7502]